MTQKQSLKGVPYKRGKSSENTSEGFPVVYSLLNVNKTGHMPYLSQHFFKSLPSQCDPVVFAKVTSIKYQIKQNKRKYKMSVRYSMEHGYC